MITREFIESEYENYLKEIENNLGHNTTTNNIELNQLCKYLFKKKFRGVFSSDKVPEIKNNESCIINLDTSDQSGSHWVAGYKCGGKLLFYDSFGRCHKTIIKTLKNTYDIIKNTEDDTEQNIVETNCGQRCIAFLCVCYEYGFMGGCYV